MGLIERLNERNKQALIKKGYIEKEDKPILRKELPKEEHRERTLETAINKITSSEDWDGLYNDIIDKPSKPGFLAKNFGNVTIDLLWFENYMLRTIPAVNLSNVIMYKNVKFFTEKKGYNKYER